MYRLILLLSIFTSLSVRAQQSLPTFDMLGSILDKAEYYLDDTVITFEYCLCKYDDFTTENLDLTVNQPGSKDNLIACKEFVRSATNPEEHSEGESQQLLRAELAKAQSGQGAKVCSKDQIKAKLAQYKEMQGERLEELKDQVEKMYCEKDGALKDKPRLVRRCREKLKYLVEEHEGQVFVNCETDVLNGGRRRAVNECVERKIYTYLWKNHQNEFFKDFCPVEEAQSLACRNDLRNKLKQTYYQSETEFCENPSNFHEAQEKAKLACEDLLISKVIALSGPSEMRAFVSCLQSAPAGNRNAIDQCVLTLRNSEDPIEKDLLAAIRDKYCSEFTNQDSIQQDNCMVSILRENMVDVAISERCLARVSDMPVSSEQDQQNKEVALRRCQRMEAYQKMLDDRTLEVANCWDNEEYPTMSDRRDCRDAAFRFTNKVVRCEEKKTAQAIDSCLRRLNRGDLAPMLTNYLETKAYKLEQDVSACRGNPQENECLLNQLSEQTTEFAGTDQNECYLRDNYQMCEQENESNSLIANSGASPQNQSNGGAGANLASSTNPLANSNGNRADDQTFTPGSAPEDQVSEEGIDLSNTIDSNLNSLVTDAHVVTNTNRSNTVCECLFNSSMYSLGSTVLSNVQMQGQNRELMGQLTGDTQSGSVAILGDAIGNQQTANYVQRVGSAAKQREAEHGIDLEMQNVAASQPPTTCEKTEETTKVDYRKFNFNDFDKVTKNSVKMIANAKTEYEMKQLINEYKSYIEGEDIYIGSEEKRSLIEELDFNKEDHAVLPYISAVGMKIYSELFLANAYGVTNDPNSMMGVLNNVLVSTSFNQSDRDLDGVNKSDALSRLVNNSNNATIDINNSQKIDAVLLQRKEAIGTVEESMGN